MSRKAGCRSEHLRDLDTLNDKLENFEKVFVESTLAKLRLQQRFSDLLLSFDSSRLRVSVVQ